MAHKKHSVALLLSGVLLCAAPAGAAELGPYFPLPGNLSVSGKTPREGLLQLEENWLKNGLANLAKAKKETEAALDKDLAAKRQAAEELARRCRGTPRWKDDKRCGQPPPAK